MSDVERMVEGRVTGAEVNGDSLRVTVDVPRSRLEEVTVGVPAKMTIGVSIPAPPPSALDRAVRVYRVAQAIGGISDEETVRRSVLAFLDGLPEHPYMTGSRLLDGAAKPSLYLSPEELAALQSLAEGGAK